MRSVTMTVCVQWNPDSGLKDFRLRQVSNLGPLISRPAFNLLGYWGPGSAREISLHTVVEPWHISDILS